MWYGWWKKSCTTQGVRKCIITAINATFSYTLSGAGFFPSTNSTFQCMHQNQNVYSVFLLRIMKMMNMVLSQTYSPNPIDQWICWYYNVTFQYLSQICETKSQNKVTTKRFQYLTTKINKPYITYQLPKLHSLLPSQSKMEIFSKEWWKSTKCLTPLPGKSLTIVDWFKYPLKSEKTQHKEHAVSNRKITWCLKPYQPFNPSRLCAPRGKHAIIMKIT